MKGERWLIVKILAGRGGKVIGALLVLLGLAAAEFAGVPEDSLGRLCASFSNKPPLDP